MSEQEIVMDVIAGHMNSWLEEAQRSDEKL
jgi:hypothetical protein